MTAEEYYQQGNAWRKQGDFKRALDCYMEAIALDPDCLLYTSRWWCNSFIEVNFEEVYW